MNTYKPVRVTTIDQTGKREAVLVREYSLHHMNLSEMMLSGKYVYVSVEEIPALRLYSWNGFYIEHDGTRFVAHDLRVNEGMLFSADTREELHLMIENCLHDLALEEETIRVRKAAQLAKEKSR
jgi:hypothetical protein